MATSLDTIVSVAQQEPADLPRLTAAGVFIEYSRIARALERAAEAYKRIPESAQQALPEHLKELLRSADTIGKSAARLLESNR